MEALVGKLLIPFACLLGTSALGIGILALSSRRRSEPLREAPETVEETPRPTAASTTRRHALDESPSNVNQTLVIDRRALRDTAAGASPPRSREASGTSAPEADATGATRGGPSPGMARPAPSGHPSSFRGETPEDDDRSARPPRSAPDRVRPLDLVDRGRATAGPSPSPRAASPEANPRGTRPMAGPAEGAESPSRPDRSVSARPSGELRPSSDEGGGRRDIFNATRPGRSEADASAPRGPRDTLDDSTAPSASGSRRDIFESTRPQGRSGAPAPGAGLGRPTIPPDPQGRPSTDPSASLRPGAPPSGSLPRPVPPPGVAQRPPSSTVRETRSPDRASASDALPPRGESAPQGRAGGSRFEPLGVNIILQQPLEPKAFQTLPGRLEVVYGNFSPRDPREIPLLWAVGDNATPRFVFSKSAGHTVGHIQLNHYTITSGVQADLTYESGRHTLTNMVAGDEMDRYQIRVNGVPMGLGERLVLHSGDIISMGIYRLKLTI